MSFRLIAITAFMIIVKVSVSQNTYNVSFFNGLWKLEEENNSLILVKGNKSLEIYCEDEYFSCSFYDFGFISRHFVENNEEFSANSLKKSGDILLDYLYFRGLSFKFYETPDESSMELFYMRLQIFYKISQIPFKTNIALYHKSKKDHRDYTLEFLDIDVREIITSKASIYNSKQEKNKNFLKVGDIIEVQAIDSEFVSFVYHTDDENVITGYIKYSDISKKSPIPSFDPEKASTPIEKAICSDVVLASLDRQLAKRYMEVKDIIGSEIKTSQILWVKKRNQAGKGKPQKELIEFLKKTYKERLKELNDKLTED